MLRHEKQNLVDGIREQLTGASIALCADYRGITVAQVSKLRQELRQSNTKVTVVKNTLIRRAVNEAYSAEEAEAVRKFAGILEGPTLLITNKSDPIGPTKVLAKYVKDIPCLKVKGAFFEGEFLDDKKVEQLSQMPGKEELMSSLLRVILAPATNMVRLINEPASLVVRVLGAQEKKLAG
jgi:large subunit ribosomal protein L10